MQRVSSGGKGAICLVSRLFAWGTSCSYPAVAEEEQVLPDRVRSFVRIQVAQSVLV